MKIEIIYAAGCGSCKRIEVTTYSALDELGLSIPVERIVDYQEAMRRGATTSPALFINGKLMVQGRYPSIDEIKEMINQQRGLVTDVSTV